MLTQSIVPFQIFAHKSLFAASSVTNDRFNEHLIKADMVEAVFMSVCCTYSYLFVTIFQVVQIKKPFKKINVFFFHNYTKPINLGVND